jgi:radical SAM protein with 4Fe4S-binding SPASM domain
MKGKRVNIISNGNAAAKEDYEQMIKFGIDWFELPLHSSLNTIHDTLTQRKGSWKRALRSIKEISSLGGHVVCVIVITKINYRGIKDTLNFINQLGIKEIMLNRFNIGGRGISEYKELLLTKEELKEVFRQANETGAELKLNLTANVCSPFCVLNPKDYPYIRMSSCSVNIKNMPIALDIQGNLRLCNHSPVIIGNLYNDKDLSAIFNSEYCRSWKKYIPEYCLDCKYYARCLGGCRAASEQLGLTNKTVDPIVHPDIIPHAIKKYIQK